MHYSDGYGELCYRQALEANKAGLSETEVTEHVRSALPFLDPLSRGFLVRAAQRDYEVSRSQAR